MTILAQQVQDDLASAVSKDQLDLPTLPEVALRIRDAAEDDDISVRSLAAVIYEDHGLTHIIGVLPILSSAEDHPDLVNDSLTLG